MSTPARPRAYTFSLLTAGVLGVQAATGVFVSGLYRDGVWVSSVLRGQDAVALTVVLPVLLVSHVARRPAFFVTEPRVPRPPPNPPPDNE